MGAGFVPSLTTDLVDFAAATANAQIPAWVAAQSKYVPRLLTAADIPALPESQVTGLVADLAGKQPAGNYLTALTGDVTASGPGSAAATLAAVGTAGTYTKVTTDAKGRITAGTTLGAGDLPDLSGTYLTKAGNLGGLADLPTSRTNLGLGDAATHAASDFALAVHQHSAADITSGTLPIARGGTGAGTAGAAFDALAPNTTLGDLTYRGASGNVRLAGNTSATRQFLGQTGTGTASAAPAWAGLAASDIPNLGATYVKSITLNTPNLIYTNPVAFANDGTGAYSGTLGLNTQAANLVLAGPASGSPAAPAFRALVAGDIPSLDASKTTTGIFGAARLGTGTAAAGKYLDGTGTWTALPMGGGPGGSAGQAQYNNAGSFAGAAGLTFDSNGNPVLPPTTSSVGILYMGGSRFLHAYPGSGGNNTFLGVNSGNLTMSGTANVGVGYGALAALTSGGSNTGLGYGALSGLTSGVFNVAIGRDVLAATTTGGQNVAVGYGGLATNVSGSMGVAIGNGSLQYLVSGTGNTAVGAQAIQNYTSGDYNTVMGYFALSIGTSGNYNTAIGASAMDSVSGSGNTALGINAGRSKTNITQCTFVGYDAGFSGTTDGISNSTAIGCNAQVTTSNTIIFGAGESVGLGGTTTALDALDVYSGGFCLSAGSNTGTARKRGRATSAWVDSTDATRKGRLLLWACDYSGTDREGFRVESDGTQPLISFLGGAAVARQAGAAATAGATYGTNEQTMLQTVYNMARAFNLMN